MAKLNLSREELLDPMLSVSKINAIAYEGNLYKLAALTENVKFVDYDPEMLIAMSRVPEAWYQNVYAQIASLLIFSITSASLELFHYSINLIVFFIVIYLFINKMPTFQSKKDKAELERIEYIQKIFKGTEYSIDEFIKK